MLFTFVQLADPRTPSIGHLVFYLITTYPPRFAEGTLTFDLRKHNLVENIVIKEHQFITFEDTFKLLFASLGARKLIAPYATHMNPLLEQNFLKHLSNKETPQPQTPTPTTSLPTN
jgi:hypothetical protein